MSSYILPLVIVVPVMTSVVILLSSNLSSDTSRNISIWSSMLTFILSIFLWIGFNKDIAGYQYMFNLNWIGTSNINLSFGIDGISILFILLTTFLTPICLMVGYQSVKDYVKEYVVAFLIMESMMILVFSVLDLVLFYISFESILIPMFIIIGIWGSRERKIHAAIQFFLYTLIGSLFMLLAILVIYYSVGTTDIQTILNFEFSYERQLILWIAFFASFAIKIPMVPFHIWLPEAHVEAPTAGSVILAGVLLKLGGYGFLRFSLPLFPDATIYFIPLVYSMSVIAVVYSSLTTLRQIDLKKIIAYSSVAHMSYVTLGIFSLNIEGIEGSILLMLSHGLVSSALFLCVGILYDRHHTRIIKYYSGITQTMPVYSVLFLFFTLANISLPGTSSFVGEFLVLVSIFNNNTVIAFLAALGIILGAGYAMWLYNRVAFGKINVNYINPFKDINLIEISMLIPLLVMVLVMGIYPSIFLDTMHLSVYNLVELVSY
uniref:NADH-ubiquinone oxidoreductase chain 4 n=1 Tax=Imasa heleensis TaxID=2772037 RepID=A0A893DD99_9EUKA|nr:NADH dehydrogenase subunit 4 [Imasa heleensis]QRR29740.1 NADH dehydrogenase subunit 4 [Imasa heleensis]